MMVLKNLIWNNPIQSYRKIFHNKKIKIIAGFLFVAKWQLREEKFSEIPTEF